MGNPKVRCRPAGMPGRWGAVGRAGRSESAHGEGAARLLVRAVRGGLVSGQLLGQESAVRDTLRIMAWELPLAERLMGRPTSLAEMRVGQLYGTRLGGRLVRCRLEEAVVSPVQVWLVDWGSSAEVEAAELFHLPVQLARLPAATAEFQLNSGRAGDSDLASILKDKEVMLRPAAGRGTYDCFIDGKHLDTFIEPLTKAVKPNENDEVWY